MKDGMDHLESPPCCYFWSSSERYSARSALVGALGQGTLLAEHRLPLRNPAVVALIMKRERTGPDRTPTAHTLAWLQQML